MSDASEKPRMLERADQIEANLGKRIEVTGKAENAKLSALVMASDFSLYCLDISGWEELYGLALRQVAGDDGVRIPSRQ